MKEWARTRGDSVSIVDYDALSNLASAPPGLAMNDWHYMVCPFAYLSAYGIFNNEDVNGVESFSIPTCLKSIIYSPYLFEKH